MMQVALEQARQFTDGAGTLSVNFSLETGSLTALVGPSGSGKTSILRLLAGLDIPRQGQILVDGQSWLDTGRGINLRPQHRSVGYIFQDTALFPNLTVRENIYFVTPKNERALADQLIDATGLSTLAQQKPGRLSGGQQKRVALARALVRRPRLLLLDEPFAALDAAAAEQLRQVVRDLHRAWGTTTLLVSHYPADVSSLADRVITLNQGQVTADERVSQRTSPGAEVVRRVWFDQAGQVWVIETDTTQVRSANAAWGQVREGDRLPIGL